MACPGGISVFWWRESVAAQAGLSDHKTEKVINAVFDTIRRQLADGGEVSIVGFGVFHVSERAERQGRNPQTGETLTIGFRSAEGLGA